MAAQPDAGVGQAGDNLSPGTQLAVMRTVPRPAVTTPGHEVQLEYQPGRCNFFPRRCGMGNHIAPARCGDMRKGALGSWPLTNFLRLAAFMRECFETEGRGGSSVDKLLGQQGMEL